METKIKTLMSIYRMGNIVLARGVGADPSLISRWRSGEREPSKEMLSAMALFFSNRPMLQHDRAALSEMLGTPCGTQAETAAALMVWLTGDKEAVLPEGFVPEAAVPPPPPPPPPSPPPPPPVSALSRTGEATAGRPPEQEWQGRMPFLFSRARTTNLRREAMDLKMNLLAQPGRCLLYKNSLSGFFLPPDVISARYTLTGGEQNRRLLEERALFERRAGTEGWVEFLPADIYDAVSINGSCAVSGFELFADKGLTLSGDALRATLQVIRACLKRYPNFRLVWTERTALQDVYLNEGREMLYIAREPFSAAHISALPSEAGEASVLPTPPADDRGEYLLDEMIESLGFYGDA